jgi:hypothetical protein
LDDNHKNKSSEPKKTPFRFGQNVIFFYHVLEEILNEVLKIKFSSKVTGTVFDCGFSFLLDPSASSKFFRCLRDCLVVHQCS